MPAKSPLATEVIATIGDQRLFVVYLEKALVVGVSLTDGKRLVEV